jgi:hypothetical protein
MTTIGVAQNTEQTSAMALLRIDQPSDFWDALHAARAGLQRAVAGEELPLAVGGYLGHLGDHATVAVSSMGISSPLRLTDFVPVLATINAIGDAHDACSGS